MLAREELLLNPRSCSGCPSEPSFRFRLDPGDTARLANLRSSAERIARGIVCATERYIPERRRQSGILAKGELRRRIPATIGELVLGGGHGDDEHADLLVVLRLEECSRLSEGFLEGPALALRAAILPGGLSVDEVEHDALRLRLVLELIGNELPSQVAHQEGGRSSPPDQELAEESPDTPGAR